MQVVQPRRAFDAACARAQLTRLVSSRLCCSGLSFINFLVSVAFAITENKLAVLPPPPLLPSPPPLMPVAQVTYTFLLYTPSALGVGQLCGVLAYLLYPGAGQAASARLCLICASSPLMFPSQYVGFGHISA